VQRAADEAARCFLRTRGAVYGVEIVKYQQSRDVI
jgi:hypothetical protein